METSKEHIPFEISAALLQTLELDIKNENDVALQQQLSELHYADIAEILDELNLEQATYIIKLLDSETTSDVLSELEDDVREKVLQNLSVKEIADTKPKLVIFVLYGQNPNSGTTMMIGATDEDKVRSK